MQTVSRVSKDGRSESLAGCESRSRAVKTMAVAEMSSPDMSAGAIGVPLCIPVSGRSLIANGPSACGPALAQVRVAGHRDTECDDREDNQEERVAADHEQRGEHDQEEDSDDERRRVELLDTEPD